MKHVSSFVCLFIGFSLNAQFLWGPPSYFTPEQIKQGEEIINNALEEQTNALKSMPCYISFLFNGLDKFGADVFIGNYRNESDVILYYVSPYGCTEILSKITDYNEYPQHLIVFKELLPGSKLILKDLNDDILASDKIPHKDSTEYNRFIAYIGQQVQMRQQINENNVSNSQMRTVEQKCSYCNGLGWVSGNKTPTYGNFYSYWCKECRKDVSSSHSHVHLVMVMDI